MRHKITLLALTLSLSPLLVACGNPAEMNQAVCVESGCSEAELNAPVAGSVEDSSLPEEVANEEQVAAAATYKFPAFNSAWGLKRAAYDKAVSAYAKYKSKIKNGRYVVAIDMTQHSGTRRFFLFDLATGNVKRHLVSHGEGSDPNNDGYATKFSNLDGSHMSSLGAYITDATYTGKNGYSLRLRGQESTNSNAYARAVVVHPASYVNEASGKAGRSWGCPALDPSVARGMIDKIKGGALLLITK